VSNRADVGRTVYPPGKDNRPGDNTGVAPNEVHSAESDAFFWNSASDRFVFADKYHDTLALVIVSVGESGGSSVTTRMVDQKELCSERRKITCNVHLAEVRFDSPSVGDITTVFRGVGIDGSLRRTQQFGFQP
jgi:hypothetical protein